MSDNIPFEIQNEIMKRLPVKSLVQFRSVSKLWKSYIDSSEFIANYHRTQHHHHHHLLVSYFTPVENVSEPKYVSIVDDDTFPLQKFSLTVPSSVALLNNPTIVGPSQGLVCFYDTDTAVIWNPFIRKSVSVSMPDNVVGEDNEYSTVVAFGVTPDTCDPMLVKVSFDGSLGPGPLGASDTIVEVFTLSTNAWKKLTTNLPRNSVSFDEDSVVIDRFIYWHAWGWYEREPRHIMSFDMITEEFKELDLPADRFEPTDGCCISKVRESLVVVQAKMVGVNQVFSVFSVWMMMEHGDPKSLTKKYTLNAPTNQSIAVGGFRKSGELLIEMIQDDDEDALGDLLVYEPYSGHMKSVGITFERLWNVSSCIETLLLLDN